MFVASIALAYRVARRWVGAHNARFIALDAAEDAWLATRACGALHDMPAHARRRAASLARDEYYAARARVPLAAADDDGAGALIAVDAAQDARCLARAELAAVQAAAAAFPPRERAVLTLMLQGASSIEIAAATGSTVRLVVRDIGSIRAALRARAGEGVHENEHGARDTLDDEEPLAMSRRKKRVTTTATENR